MDIVVTETRSQLEGNDRTHTDENKTIDVDVSVNNAVGALFLGIASLILLVAFLLEEARNRVLMAKLLQRE
jgi:hypothetical protein